MLPTRKIESRMESDAVTASISAIAVLISKCVATVVTKSLQEMDGDPACPRICLKKFSDENFTVWGSADRNGNEGVDVGFTSADCRQLINSETVLISRTSGDILIIA